MNVEETGLARQVLAAAAGCPGRLSRSHGALASHFPLTAATMKALLGGEEIRELSRREIVELMERLGAVPSASAFRALVAIRNRVAHVYPDDPERQSRNPNEAYGAAGSLLEAHAAVRRYLEARLPPPRLSR